MTSMPLADFAGLTPSASAVRRLSTPKISGMDGPVMSASRMATLWPRFVHLGGEQAGDETCPRCPLPDTTPIKQAYIGAIVGRQGGRDQPQRCGRRSRDAAAGALRASILRHDSFFLSFSCRRNCSRP